MQGRAAIASSQFLGNRERSRSLAKLAYLKHECPGPDQCQVIVRRAVYGVSEANLGADSYLTNVAWVDSRK